MHNFEAEADLAGEMQASHAAAVDDCIVSLVRAIQALSEHSLSDLQDLVGPIIVMVNDAREEDAPPCKRRRTRSGEESGEDRSLSDDEPGNDIGDDVLARYGDREAPESGDDEPWDAGAGRAGSTGCCLQCWLQLVVGLNPLIAWGCPLQ